MNRAQVVRELIEDGAVQAIVRIVIIDRFVNQGGSRSWK